MGERVKSELDESLDYDFEFYENTLKESDKGIESDLYQINIFGNEYLIAVGGKNQHKDNENILYFNVYLVYKNKIIFKIGIYELIEEVKENRENINNRNVVFEDLKLLVDNNIYKQPYSLEEFSSFIENNEPNANKQSKSVSKNEEKVPELEDEPNVNVENAVQLDKSLILVNDTLKFKANPENDIEMFRDMIDESSINFTASDYYKLINHVYRSPVASYKEEGSVLSKIEDSAYNKFISKLFKEFLGNYIKIEKINGKNTVNYSFEKEIHEGRPIDITIPFLILLEYRLNIKIIIINANNMINSFSLLGNVQGIETYQNTSYVCEPFRKYDPIKVMFVKQQESLVTYKSVLYNSKYINDITDLSNELKTLLKTLFNATKHEYRLHEDVPEYSSYMNNFKMALETGASNVDIGLITSEPPIYPVGKTRKTKAASKKTEYFKSRSRRRCSTTSSY